MDGNDPNRIDSAQNKNVKKRCIGVVLLPASFFILWSNEDLVVRTQRGLEEGARAVVQVCPERFDPSNEGKLVPTSGDAETGEMLTDGLTGLSMNAIRLGRSVERYQWIERSKSRRREKPGGGTETVTTCGWEKGWSPVWIDSANFRKPEGRANPSMEHRSLSRAASRVRFARSA